MKRTFKNLAGVLLAAVLFTSCGNDASLQRYYVDHQETNNFIAQDFPLSLIDIDTSLLNDVQQDAYNSVDKLNFLGFKVSDTNTEIYQTELGNVTAILRDSKYNDLMEFSDKGNKISVKYLGNEDAADEVIVFGSAPDKGFGIVRILGDDMNPEKMVTLINAMQHANIDEGQVERIMSFFK